MGSAFKNKVLYYSEGFIICAMALLWFVVYNLYYSPGVDWPLLVLQLLPLSFFSIIFSKSEFIFPFFNCCFIPGSIATFGWFC